jgi:hypothetical protein
MPGEPVHRSLPVIRSGSHPRRRHDCSLRSSVGVLVAQDPVEIRRFQVSTSVIVALPASNAIPHDMWLFKAVKGTAIPGDGAPREKVNPRLISWRTRGPFVRLLLGRTLTVLSIAAEIGTGNTFVSRRAGCSL